MLDRQNRYTPSHFVSCSITSIAVEVRTIQTNSNSSPSSSSSLLLPPPWSNPFRFAASPFSHPPPPILPIHCPSIAFFEQIKSQLNELRYIYIYCCGGDRGEFEMASEQLMHGGGGHRYFPMQSEASLVTMSSHWQGSGEPTRMFDELPKATIVSVSRPDASDISPMLLSYTIECQYKQVAVVVSSILGFLSHRLLFEVVRDLLRCIIVEVPVNSF